MNPDIISAAVRFDDQVFTGRDHAEAYAKAEKGWLGPGRAVVPVMGFLTSDDRFVDRAEALEIAVRANQVPDPGPEDRILVSKMLNQRSPK